MDKKITATIIVAIVVIAAVAVGAYALTGGDDEKTSLGEGRVLVYGNADNDDYLDEEDVEFIKSIVDGETTWNKTKNPYADANNDGVVDSKDVDYLQNFLDGGSGKMYYVGYDGNTYYFNYPLGNKKICVSSEYGLMLCEVLGVYDQITAGSTRLNNYSENRYPGCHTTMEVIGTWSSSDLASFVEAFLDSGCEVLMGQLSTSAYDMLHEAGDNTYDHVLLSASAAKSCEEVDIVTSIMTLGVLFDKGEEARAYAAAYDDLIEYIEEGTQGLETYTSVVAYNTSNAVTTSVDTYGADAGSVFGDVWTISHLPTTDIMDHIGTGCYDVEIEEIIARNPDVLFISMWGVADVDTSPEEAQAAFEEKAAYFSETNAYKKGMVFGVNYETIGTYMGASALALLASYIWPDSFDEDEGWDILQSWYDQFTVYDGNVREAGGLIVFKMSS